MKTINLLFFSLLISASLHAQFKKNTILLGGDLSFNSQKDENAPFDYKNSAGQFFISIGKAFKENSVAGFHLGYSSSNQEYFNGNDVRKSDLDIYRIGAFFRKYKGLGKNFYFFGDASASFLIGNGEEAFYNSPEKIELRTSGVSVGLTPGLAYQVFKKLQLEVNLPNLVGANYSLTKRTNLIAGERKTENFAFYSSLSNAFSLGALAIGIRLTL